VIEDFGDKSYYKILLKSKNKLKIYKKLIDTLLKIQKIKPKFKIKNIDRGFHQINNYSKKYLLKESNLFFDWYLPLFISKNKALNIKKKSNKILSKLYNKLNSSDNCFVHRDYHIQNLLNVNKKVGLIDSQDALIGNPAYDLVSIIDDVRIKTSIQLKKKIYTYYIKKKFSKNQGDLNKFFEDFNILSVQRNLKIIGIFSRLFIRDQKKQYLKLLPYTWELLERRMNNKNFFLLKKILKENIPKSIRKKIIKK
jgi:aminoglycoside/choline kinase family phosphotransferase